MLTWRRLYGRNGEFLRLVDDDEARDLVSAGKALVKRERPNRGRPGAISFRLGGLDGPPMRGFPCGLSRTVSRVCVENWPRGYWEYNQRATHWAEAL